jgi:uncharacterized small protein (DUF1192 family)
MASSALLEIARARAAIASKQSVRGAAEALFKKR